MQEVIARGAKVLLITNKSTDEIISENIWETLEVENTNQDLLPFLLTIPLQKLAYYSALKKGFDIDKLLGKTANIEVGETKNGNPKIIGLFKPDGGVQSVPTINETQKFDLDIYCKEWTGETCDESKAMCDVFADFPPWLQEDIEDSFEYKAAVKKGEDAGIVREKGPEAQELSEKVDEMIAQNKNPLTDEDIPF